MARWWGRLPRLVRYTAVCVGLTAGVLLFFTTVLVALDWYTSQSGVPDPAPHGPSTETY